MSKQPVKSAPVRLGLKVYPRGKAAPKPTLGEAQRRVPRGKRETSTAKSRENVNGIASSDATRLPPRTDAGNAELFAALYKDKVRYDHRRRRWLIWRGHWWAEDVDGEILRMAKRAARARYRLAINASEDQRIKEARWALMSEGKYRLEATLALAQSEPLLADAGDNWDSDPWLLGVGNGLVDLRTGTLRAGRPEDRITMHTAVPFDPSAEAPRWEQVLFEVFEGDMGLIDFFQRAIGYSICGETSEQCIFGAYGGGSNGKTTLFEALRRALGAYTFNVPFSALELKSRSAIPNDIAALVGRRFVTASETSESIQLNEARVKSLTGSDSITARFLHKEYFSFQPVAKIWLAFNHKPVVTDDSYGFWRRIRLIPFTRVFRGADMDKDLARKLEAETPGILAWAVRGCLKWQQRGLGMPSAVRAATEGYRAEMDLVGEFISECCVVNREARVTAAALWDLFSLWARENGEYLDRRAFARRLEARGFKKTRIGHGRTWTWTGICRKIDAQVEGICVDADVRSDADVNLDIFPKKQIA